VSMDWKIGSNLSRVKLNSDMSNCLDQAKASA